MMREIHNERTFSFSGTASNSRLPGERIAFFASGREALVALTRSLGFGREATILLPGFVAEGVYAPFQRAGCNVVFYPLDENLIPKWERVSELLDTHRPQASVFIHYFGLKMPVERFAAECRTWKTLVIEDFAHCTPLTLFSGDIAGDVALYSFPKTLAVPDGAALRFSTEQMPKELSYEFDSRHVRYCMEQLAQLLGNTASLHLPSKIGFMLRALIGARCSSYKTLMDYFEHPNRMCWFSKWLLHRQDLQTIAERRTLHSALYQAKLSPAFRRFDVQGSGSVSGIGYPVKVERRDGLMRALRGYAISGVCFEDRWDFLPPDADGFEQVRAILKQNFLFPTAPHLTEREIERVILAANSWADRELGVR